MQNISSENSTEKTESSNEANMDPFVLDKKLQQALIQRNTMCAFTLILLGCSMLLSVAVFTKSEKTVLVPAGLQKEVEVSGYEASSGYVEEMTNFFVTMLLDVTPSDVDYKFKLILKHVSPDSYHALEKHLKEEAQKYKKYNLSTTFIIDEIKMLDSSLEVLVIGKLTSKFLESGSFEKKATYKISYKNVRGRLFIKEFNQVAL